MAYVNCSTCDRLVHFSPINLEEFKKRFVDGNEPTQCFKCFKQLKDKEFKEIHTLKDEILDPVLKELAERMVEESEELYSSVQGDGVNTKGMIRRD